MKTNSLILKKFLCLFMIFAILFFGNGITSIANASTRGAEEVLTELISLKNQWFNTTDQRTRDNLTKRADGLRDELKQTKEYRDNVKVSSRNFMVEEGKDPGFKKVADVLCFPPNDTISNVESALDYIKAYNMSFWGEVCVIVGGIIFSGTLIYAGATYGSAIIAGAGYTASQWESDVISAIQNISQNTQTHILQEHHVWNRLFGSNVTWEKVSSVLQKVLLYGELSDYKGYSTKIMEIDGQIVEVEYNIVDGVLKIVNAWIQG